MPMKKLLIGLVTLTLLWLLFVREPAVTYGPGVLAPEPPVQTDPLSSEMISYRDFRITPLAGFSLDARVLGSERYRIGRDADLAPLDLALGWGRMSDESVYGQLTITQGGRWYHYRWSSPAPPIPVREIIEHSANMHLIPANDEVEDAMLSARRGDLVRLEGHLVRADADGGWYWKSSLTRSDSGANSCELIWVERFEIRQPWNG